MKMTQTCAIMCAMAACSAFDLTAMPTKEETDRAEPVVRKLMAPERAALESGKKTRSEVAAAAIRLADKTDTDAEKLLLMKGAFSFYVQDGELEKAVAAMNSLRMTIGVTPQVVSNIVEGALVGAFRKNEDQLRRLLGEGATEKTQKALSKLFPGWKLETEVFPHEFAGLLACHNGLKDVVFVHPKDMKTPAVLGRTVTLSNKNPCLFLKVASAKDGDFLLSVRVNGKVALSNRLVKTPDWGLWDNVIVPLSAWRGRKVKLEVVLTANGWWNEFPCLASLEIAEGSVNARNVTVDGRTWSYRVDNGKAMVVAEAVGQFACALSQKPTGSVDIPSTLDGVRVTGIGREAFFNCRGLKAVTIPVGVTNVGWCAFYCCSELASVMMPASVKNIDRGAFAYCRGLKTLTIPSSVSEIGVDAFMGCHGLESLTILGERPNAPDDVFKGCGSLKAIQVPANAKSWAGMKKWQGIPLVFDGAKAE